MVLPEGVLMEILLRLPLKYLCLCKCVSKTWWSIISEIKKLHHARNLGIFISNFGCSSSSSLFQARLGLDNNKIPLFKKLVGGSESAEIGFTQVINGLFCFYTQGVGGVLTLCNCYTCETRNIPLPRFSWWTHKIQFYLGFDLSGGNYKLLSLGSPRNHDLVMYQAILTLGGMNNHNITIGSWIKMLPTDSLLTEIDVLCKPSLCINGILHWLVECKDNKRKILAFNLLRGCFYDIFLPAEIAAAAAKMVSFKGSSTVESLAVGCLVAGEDSVTSSSKLNIWELNKWRSWIKHSINLPEELVRCNREMWCSFGNFPTGEILLANPKANDDSDFFPIYSYDHSTQKFQRFVLGKFTPCMVGKSYVQISCVELNRSCHSLEALLLKQPISALQFREKYLRIHYVKKFKEI
ncbi:hypothetical protein P3S67_026480 [Capsicum chacoense]